MRKALASCDIFPSLPVPHTQMWFAIALGRSGIHLTLLLSFREMRVGAKIVIRRRRVEQVLPRLTAQKAEIEKEIGFALDWDPYPEKEVRTIAVWRAIDINKRDNWPAAIDMLTSLAVKMYGAFSPRVMQMDLKG